METVGVIVACEAEEDEDDGAEGGSVAAGGAEEAEAAAVPISSDSGVRIEAGRVSGWPRCSKARRYADMSPADTPWTTFTRRREEHTCVRAAKKDGGEGIPSPSPPPPSPPTHPPLSPSLTAPHNSSCVTVMLWIDARS